MTLTNIYERLKTLLDAYTWTAHGSTPGVWEYNLMYFRKNKEGIMIKKQTGELMTLANGTVLYEDQQAEIQGWSKNTKATRDNLKEDLIDALKSDGGYVLSGLREHDAPKEHNFRIKVKRIEVR